MSLLRYVRSRCDCCGLKVPRGTGYVALFAFVLLCDGCMSNRCVHHLLPPPSHWIHKEAK